MQTKTLHGPGGIRIELDRGEIFPDDPGAGTPAMVYLREHHATYGCALDTGELSLGDVRLSGAQLKWLESVIDDVNDFISIR